MSDSITSFLETIRTALSVGPHRAGRITRELEDHMESSAAVLRSAGRTPEEAEREAIARFGSPESLAHALNAVRGDTRRIKTWRISLAILTSLLALAIIVYALSAPEASNPVALKLGAPLAILVYGVFTVLWPDSLLNHAGGVGVVLIGFFIIICRELYAHWIGPSYEVSIIVIGLLLVLQGGLSAVNLFNDALTT
jgi:hypothetical protein